MKASVLHGLLGLFHRLVIGDHIGHFHLVHTAIDQNFHVGGLLYHNARIRVLIHDLTGLLLRIIAVCNRKFEVLVLFIGNHVFIELPDQIGHLNQIIALLGTVVPIIEEIDGGHGNAHDHSCHQNPLNHHDALGTTA